MGNFAFNFKALSRFSKNITVLYKVYEINFPDYYHCHIDSPIDDDNICCHYMSQQYKANNCRIPMPPPNKEESIRLEEINRNMQPYFTYEFHITNTCHRVLLALKESMSNLEIRIKNQILRLFTCNPSKNLKENFKGFIIIHFI